jgi:hypothetical protein
MRALLNRRVRVRSAAAAVAGAAILRSRARSRSVVIARVTRHRRWERPAAGLAGVPGVCVRRAARRRGRVVATVGTLTCRRRRSRRPANVLHFAAPKPGVGLPAPRQRDLHARDHQRQIRMPRLPRSLDGLSILHITDLHMNASLAATIFEWAAERCARLNADLVAMTGDMMDHLAVLDWLPTTLGAIEGAARSAFRPRQPRPHTPAATRCGGRDGTTRLDSIRRGRVVAETHRDVDSYRGTEQPWAGSAPPIDGSPAPATSFRILLSHARTWSTGRGGDNDRPRPRRPPARRANPVASHRPRRRRRDCTAACSTCIPTILHVGRGLRQMGRSATGSRPEITKLILRAPCRSAVRIFFEERNRSAQRNHESKSSNPMAPTPFASPPRCRAATWSCGVPR